MNLSDQHDIIKQGYRNLQIKIYYTSIVPGANPKSIGIFRALYNDAMISNEPGFSPYGTADGITVYPLNNAVAFGTTGAMYFNISDTEYITVLSENAPYRSILEFLKSNKLHVKRVRYTVNKVELINTNFLQVKRNIFGDKEADEITPLLFKKPTQVQGMIVDIPLDIILDGDTGFVFDLNKQDGITLDFLCKIVS